METTGRKYTCSNVKKPRKTQGLKKTEKIQVLLEKPHIPSSDQRPKIFGKTQGVATLHSAHRDKCF